MTRGQRWLLGAVGCLIVVVSLAWVAAAAGSDGDEPSRSRASANGESETTERTDTTLPLVPVTSGAPLPPTSTTPPSVPLPTPEQVAAAIPSTSAPPGSTSTAAAPAPPPALTAEGALLTRPSTDQVRPVDKARGCHSANDPGWRIVECGALRRGDGVQLWVVQSRNKGLRVLVLRERTAGQWVTVLSAADDDGTRWSRVGVRGGDVSGDGQPDLVFGFHLRSGDKALALDVVDNIGVVGLHRLLPGGSARLEPGALHGFAALADGSYEHTTYKWLANAWRVAATERMAREAVPPSMV